MCAGCGWIAETVLLPCWGVTADAAKLLTRLGQQLTTLLQAEEHTREALADWAALAASFSPRLRGSSSSGAPRGSPARAAAATAAAAAEEGMALLTRQAQELTDPLQHELESGVEAASQQGHELPAVSLDDLAAAVRQQHPALFASTVGIPAGSGSPAHQAGEGGAELRLHQAAALWDVLHRQQRFKYEPFEWVYEGLQPLLLPPWLHRRKLAPLTLGVVVAGVARRLGLPLLPVPADGGEDIAAGVIEGPAGGATTQSQLPLEQLRPDVAQRYAGRAQGMAPSAAPWVLLLAGGDCEGASGAGAWDGSFQWTHVLDACTGEAVDMAAAPTKYPTLQLVSGTGSALQHHAACLRDPSAPQLPLLDLCAAPAVQSADWHVEAPLVAWQHMVRTIIQVRVLRRLDFP